MFLYTVKKGDNLYSISIKYNTTVKEILKLNNLNSDNLYIGQTLRIPEMYTKEEEMYLPQYTNYVVKKGDSLYSIAKKYNIDVNTLKKDNSLVNDNITVGQNLKIRTGNEVIEECFGEDYIDDKKYIVQKGDSLYSIAKKYNTTVDNIKNKNNLKTNNLSIGQELII